MRRVVLGAILIGCSDTATSTIDAPGVTNIAGHVTASATWQGDIAITAATTIDQGVTVSVMPGATIAVGQGLGITVLGALELDGSSGSMVTIEGDSPWAGVTIGGSGSYTTHYTRQSNGGVHLVSAGAMATVMDSALSHGNGDLVTVDGGKLDIEYSSLGLATGMTDTTYDDIRIDAATMIAATHTNVSTAMIGVGLYAGSSSDFTYDNWFSNQTDLDKTPGTSVSCDVSFGWFANGAPSGSGITAANMATSQVTDAGPRL